jgi:hypothetical protein
MMFDPILEVMNGLEATTGSIVPLRRERFAYAILRFAVPKICFLLLVRYLILEAIYLKGMKSIGR